MSNRPRIRSRPGPDAGPGVVAATLSAVLFAAQASLVVLTPVVPDLAAEFGLNAVALSAGGYEALGATFSVLFACSLLPQLRTRRAERGSTARASTVQLLIPTPPKPRPAPA